VNPLPGLAHGAGTVLPPHPNHPPQTAKGQKSKWQAKEISLENGRFGMVLARNVNNEAKERGALLSASGARGTIGDYD